MQWLKQWCNNGQCPTETVQGKQKKRQAVLSKKFKKALVALNY